jgi:hypothetical protein
LEGRVKSLEAKPAQEGLSASRVSHFGSERKKGRKKEGKKEGKKGWLQREAEADGRSRL